MAHEALSLADVDAFYGDSHVLQQRVVRRSARAALLGLHRPQRRRQVHLHERRRRPAAAARRHASRCSAPTSRALPPERIAAHGVALVPQGRRVFKSLTVRENLARRGAHAQRRGKAFWTVETVFEMFPRLKERRSQLASLLSGGEQQMLAIGRALMANPRVLLMDEPSEGLAPQIVADVGRTIARLKGEGLSIVLVEQNIKLTLELADDIVILNSGSVVFAGAAGELKMDDAIVAQHLGVH